MSNLTYRRSYRRNLPHIQPPGATLFVTFRLAGSLPANVVNHWKQERQWLEHLYRNNPAYYEIIKANFDRVWFAKFEAILDGATSGPLWLRDEGIASLVADSLHHRDGRVYRLMHSL